MSALFAYVVELWCGPLGWVDITPDVRAEPGLTVRRGVRRPGHHADHTTLRLRVDNGAGRYSRHDPASDLHPHLGRNTPIRVSAGRVDGPLVGRFTGAVSSWSRGWSTTGADRWVELECAGLLRRWGQGASPSWSAVRHAIEATNPVAYWPLEDGELAESAGAAVSTAPPMTVTGEVEFRPLESRRIRSTNGSYYTLPWAVAALADLAAGGSLSAQVPAEATAATGAAKAHTVHVIWQPLLANSLPDVDYVLLEWTTQGGTLTRWQMRITAIPTRTQWVAIDANGAEWVVAEMGGASGSLQELSICLSEVNGIVYLAVYDKWPDPVYSGTVAGTLGGVTSVSVNPSGATSDSIFPVGHVAVWASGPPPVLPAWSVRDPYGVSVGAHLTGHYREDAADRIVRAAAAAGVTVDVSDASDAHPTRMGVQQVGTAAEVIAAAIEVDGGMLVESRDSAHLLYRRRTSLYNQTPLTLDYSAGLLVPPVTPVDDDDLVRNDITIQRRDGGSARAIQTTGPLAALPPNGVGVYQDERTLLLMSDGQLADHAGWTLHLGTVDEPRVPQITVQLDASGWQADPDLLDAALAVDAGDVLDVVGLPDWLAADLPRLRLLVTGSTETITEQEWRITWEGEPATPWDVATVDGPQRVAADGSTIAAVGADTLALTLISTAANGAWTIDPTDFPMDLRIGGGERVTATGITGTGLTQTVTLSARGVNGVSRSWPDGTEAQVWDPAVVPL